MHFRNPSNRKYLLCFHDKSPPRDYKGPYYSLHYDNEAFDEYSMLEYPDEVASLHGCSGLICYNKANNPKRLYLWNPAIRKLKVLPASPHDHDDRFCTSSYKLCFDCKTNDYMILKIIIYPSEATTVELYSMNSNSWKLISDNAPVTCFGTLITNLSYVNGVWYWLALTNGTKTLVSLNTENWMFREVKTWTTGPIFLTPIYDRYLVILGYAAITCGLPWCCSVSEVYDERLSKFFILVYGHTVNKNVFDGWAPIGVRNNGEFLLQNFSRHNFEIVSCNLETAKINSFVPRFSHKFRKVFPYTESLALLDDADASTV